MDGKKDTKSITLSIRRDSKLLHDVSQDVKSNDIDDLLTSIQKIKEVANELLTDLVNEEQQRPQGQARSKRRFLIEVLGLKSCFRF